MNIKNYDVSLSKKDGYEKITIDDFVKRESLSYKDEKKILNQVFAVNIHIMLSEETIDQVYETMNDYINGEERLKGLNAIVLLSLKKKGRGIGFTPLIQEKFKKLVDFAMDNNVPIGFDSCSCHKFLNSIKERDDYKKLEMLSEPCESTCFSAYINCKGYFFPCSFTEGEGIWKNGIYVPNCGSFKHNVWMNKKTKNFRNNLLENKRMCPVFKV